MKPHYYLLPQAEQDMKGIALYTRRHWDKIQAKSYVTKIIDSMNALAQPPGIGRDAAHLRPHYRLYQSGSHVIFYQLANHGISIIRILHERMDAKRHFNIPH